MIELIYAGIHIWEQCWLNINLIKNLIIELIYKVIHFWKLYCKKEIIAYFVMNVLMNE